MALTLTPELLTCSVAAQGALCINSPADRVWAIPNIARNLSSIQEMQ